jgi:hypothetical protein
MLALTPCVHGMHEHLRYPAHVCAHIVSVLCTKVPFLKGHIPHGYSFLFGPTLTLHLCDQKCKRPEGNALWSFLSHLSEKRMA